MSTAPVKKPAPQPPVTLSTSGCAATETASTPLPPAGVIPAGACQCVMQRVLTRHSDRVNIDCMTPVGTIPDLIDTIEHIADEHRTDRRCVTTISTGLDTLYVELSERAFSAPAAARTFRLAGPVAWPDERTGAHPRDYDQQHGCGEWNSPESLLIKIDLDTLADMDEGDVDTTVRDRPHRRRLQVDGAVAAATPRPPAFGPIWPTISAPPSPRSPTSVPTPP